MCIVHSACVLIRNYKPLYLIIEREQTTEQQQEQQQTNDKYAQIDTSDKIQTSSQIYENTGGMCMHAENVFEVSGNVCECCTQADSRNITARLIGQVS